MGWIRPEHVVIIVVVALLIFGPSRLPEIGRSFGKMLREFQSATKEATQGFAEEVSTKPAPVQTTPVQPVEVKKEEVKVNCKSCGKPIAVGMKFCPECGAAQ